MLISRGAKLNVCNDEDNHSPLDQCAWHTNAAEAKLLLQAGADPKAGSGLYTEQKAREHGNLAEFQAQARGEAASSFIDPNIVVASVVNPDESPGGGGGGTLTEVLLELQAAFQQGLLTKEEFEAAKEKALDFMIRGTASDYVQTAVASDYVPTAVAVAATPGAAGGDAVQAKRVAEDGTGPPPETVTVSGAGIWWINDDWILAGEQDGRPYWRRRGNQGDCLAWNSSRRFVQSIHSSFFDILRYFLFLSSRAVL